jgi:hypothetical protein
LLGAALWLGRELVSKRLTKAIEHEFNVKLETLRSEISASEARLNAELRVKETDIAALRSGALSALSSRQVALDKRRLEAVDQLWASAIALGPARAIAGMISTFNFEVAAERAVKEPKLRAIASMIGNNFDPSKLDLSAAEKARPFLTPMVWAVYSAMRAVAMHGVMRWMVIKGGLGSANFVNDESVKELIKAVLPHWSEYLDKHGASVYYNACEQLEARLLVELQIMLSGSVADQYSIEQSLEIMRLSNKVLNEAEVSRDAT